MDFIAIDVETANADMASICQIGLAKFENGDLVAEWSSLINPEDFFDYMNVSVHGIEPDDVANAPTLPEVASAVSQQLNGSILVCHTHFDRVSMGQAFDKYSLPPLTVKWLDSARVARRTWSECARSGYGLSAICDRIGYEFKHHDALEDAKACGHVLLHALKESQISLEDWLVRVEKPINPSASRSQESIKSASRSQESIKRDGNPDGPLFGELAVFTGSLTIKRSDAADAASEMGIKVTPSVTKKTTLLIVGDQDVTKLAGHDKSSKHRKAEDLIKKGQPIRILRESDFRVMLEQHRA